MFGAFARAVEQRVGEFEAQSLGNTAWAYATAAHADALLFTTLAILKRGPIPWGGWGDPPGCLVIDAQHEYVR